jgi:nucleoside recognition membrane protein YjiH
MLTTILLVASFILFLLATIGIPSPSRFNLLAAGLACWVAAQLFGPLLR